MSCQDRPRPIMFVDKGEDHTVIGNFMKKKYLALSQLIGKPEIACIYFSSADFTNLINTIAGQPGAAAMKVYFASWCTTGVPVLDNIVQADYKDLMTLIFCPMDENLMDIQVYYIVRPFGGVINIPKAAASLMVSAFQKIKVPLITEIIYDAGRPDFSETLSMWYELAKLNGPNGALAEITCQGAAGISAFLGSYDEAQTATASDQSTVKLGWCMTLIFELAKTVNYNGVNYPYHVDLEDTGGWGSRPKPAPVARPMTARAIDSPGKVYIEGMNTGNPCPPATGCNNSLP